MLLVFHLTSSKKELNLVLSNTRYERMSVIVWCVNVPLVLRLRVNKPLIKEALRDVS